MAHVSHYGMTVAPRRLRGRVPGVPGSDPGARETSIARARKSPPYLPLKVRRQSADKTGMSSIAVTEAALAARAATLPAWPADIRHIARQPILDLHGRLHGYELLLEAGVDEDREARDPQAVRTILDDLVLFGFGRLTGGALTFIPCTAEVLTEQLVTILPPAVTVLEIPHGLEMSPRLIAACSILKNAGFRFLLDHFQCGGATNALLDLADYVKVDFMPEDASEYSRLRARLKGTTIAMMTGNVHSREAFRRAAAEGFSHFQGYYFCEPEPIENAKIPANRLFHIEILRQLFRDPLDLKELCPLVMRDASLVYRLLRLVNSPLCAVRSQVNSVEAAIVFLGENTFRRIATLAIQCELSAGQPPEILHVSLVRARFCELAAPLAKMDPNEQYLLGMFSLLPAMLRLPMETLAAELPLRPAVVEALLGTETPERRLLAWIESLERCNFPACHRMARTGGLDNEQLKRLYLEAVVWDAAKPAISA